MQNSIFRHPVLMLKLFASVMYVTMGLLIGLMPDAFGSMLEGITPALVYTFSGLLIVYGVFRFVRVIREYREYVKNTEDEDSAE